MSHRFLLALGLLALAGPAQAQTARDLTEISMDLYQAANSTTRMDRINREMYDDPVSWLIYENQPGVLYTAKGQRVRVPALRYNPALHLVEARDSTGKQLWNPETLSGFEFGSGTGRRQFRVLPVRNRDVNKDFVEVLTADPKGQLMLGAEHVFIHEDQQLHPVLKTVIKPAVNQVVYDAVVGYNTLPPTPLRPIGTLREKTVLRLFGSYAGQVAAYARQNHLNYEALADVLRMANYYNELVSK